MASVARITRNRLLAAGAALAIIIVGFALFLSANEERILEQNAQYLEGSTQQTARRIDDSFTNALSSIRTAAAVYGDSLTSDEVDPASLGALGANTPFDYIVFVDASGRAYDSIGNQGDATQLDYFLNGMRGETDICAIEESAFTGESVLAFYTPLTRDGRIIGVMAGAYSNATVTDIMTTYFFGQQTTTYLCSKQGEILARSSVFPTPVENIYDLYAEEANEGTRNELAQAFQTGSSISFTYHASAGTGNAYMMKLPSFDYMVMRTFPESITGQMVANADQAGINLLIMIAAAFVFFIVVILVQARRQSRQLLLEKHQSDRIVDASINLFQRFVVIDLNAGTYEYLKKEEVAKGLKAEGTLDGFRRFWVEHAYSEDDARVIERSYDDENIRKNLTPDVPYLQLEYRVTDPGTKQLMWIQASILCLDRDAAGQPTMVLCAAQDVTEVKQHEQTVREALEEAYQAADQASKAKSDFLNSMSHDIRTPMNSIMGLTAIASMHADDTERVKDSLGKITTASRHLLSLINEVLDMAKIESGKIGLSEEAFNLSETVEGLLTIVAPQIDAKHQNLKVEINDIVHEHVVGDPMRLQQVFVNIMGNAVKFTPEGGSVELRITELPSRMAGHGCYQFVFADTGCGMSPEFVERVFEPFSRANDSRVTKVEGTGLGMSIAKSVVSLMNGTIDVESTLGEGSTFTVTINLKIQDHVEEDLQHFAGMRVLVADDELATCENAVAILQGIGMQAEYVLSGDEACARVAQAQEAGQDFSIVILDWRMPGKSGVEAARDIRNVVKADMPIIVLSAYDWSAIEQEAREVGIDAFISKPLFRSRLVMVMQDLLFSDRVEKEDDETLLRNAGLEGRRILLTEDNAIAAAIAQDLLEMTGAQVDHAENGQIAVDMLSDAEPGTYDLVFMDIQMPVMNGYDAARAIRAKGDEDRPDLKELPIIALTADAFTEDIQRAHASGMNAHMSKPLEIPNLLRMLKEWLG